MDKETKSNSFIKTFRDKKQKHLNLFVTTLFLFAIVIKIKGQINRSNLFLIILSSVCSVYLMFKI
jgi:Ca2+/Na+ antiporter